MLELGGRGVAETGGQRVRVKLNLWGSEQEGMVVRRWQVQTGQLRGRKPVHVSQRLIGRNAKLMSECLIGWLFSCELTLCRSHALDACWALGGATMSREASNLRFPLALRHPARRRRYNPRLGMRRQRSSSSRPARCIHSPPTLVPPNQEQRWHHLHPGWPARRPQRLASLIRQALAIRP